MSHSSVLELAQREYGDRRAVVEMTFDEYLDGCRSDPLMYAGPAERMLDAIGEPRFIDTATDQRLGRDRKSVV